ncbi:MAG: CO dehydrogenase/acetyl-CoA synthase subunit delta [Candidatus Bathyarchaeota archaeon]
MEKNKDALKNLSDILSRYGEVELENLTLNAENLEITLKPNASANVSDIFLKKELVRAFAELGKVLSGLSVATPAVPTLAPPLPPRPKELPEIEYHLPVREYPGKLVEVTLGATKSQGGTRGKTLTIGGESMPAFHLFEKPQPHPPIIAGDVFDTPISLPSPVSKSFGKETLKDPLAWAKMWVEKFGADIIDLELISTDPYTKDTPVNEAVKLVEDMLQTVDVPLMIGGSGNPEKDAKLMPKVAEVCSGERILLSSATIDMWEPVAKAAKEYNQVVLAWTSIEMNQAKELNRRLFGYIPPEQIVMDPTSAALGYGLEYAFTVMERIRLAAIMGDKELQCPQGSGTANSWGAREAWKTDPELGPRNYRGPMWETAGALTYLLAGIDLFIMLHPGAVRTIKDVMGWLMGEKKPPTFPEWIGIGK